MINKCNKFIGSSVVIFIGLSIQMYSQEKPVIEWVSVPAGTFVMGSPSAEYGRFRDENQHKVTLDSFKISKYEITFDQYDAFCEATGRDKPRSDGWGRGTRPVINITWEDANAFCDWYGCRLPTEAEWEYACRAGTTTTFYTGNCLDATEANYNANFPYYGCKPGRKYSKTQPVGSYPPNAWGLHDMHGNVSEYCIDSYAPLPSAEQVNPIVPPDGFFIVFRGGNFLWGAEDCRSAQRASAPKFEWACSIGFRVAKSE